ncbi:hypothetical protein ATX62_03140 [Oenococcus oeni]|uniref:hypothetical protein n=1 Tax=Oenococcus oeni TaxID=1247 RepID=UPI0008F9469C|nr:hypothetical protein [Oenococcus oeni]OIK87776.1 hypothetical protein ATW79_03155 [Oenococcus oeni]OIL09937.1 hypothetical protein ATW92_03085 [Oenococcus oeni]OIL15363.1 hypothetical protein ATW93_03180 [Oenococcus oeni]OIM25759.1 hypothetical protein ATX62_03140 [Oenococcus oeni]
MDEDFKEQLEALRNGEIDQFEVTSETFPDFYKAWSDFSFQSSIKGFAQKGGKIIYRRKEKVE